MKSIVSIVVFIFTASGVFAQTSKLAESSNENSIALTSEQAKSLYENEKLLKKWIKELKTPGVIVNDDEMNFNEEALRLIEDKVYRDSVYKQVYTFEDVKKSLERMNIQKAFWQMIKMYPENKETVLQYIFAYDSKIPTDEVVTASFYTYAFFDPEITTIENGKPNIYRPDLFEEYLKRTKEIVGYISYFRKEAASR